MKLWLIKAKLPQGHDCKRGSVVRAQSPSSARKRASSWRGDEGKDFWLDPKLSTCKELKAEGKAGVILVDFLEG